MSPHARRLVLVGSVVVDFVVRIPELPQRGGDVIADDPRFVVGGGYYVLAAAARAGAPTAFAGRHGSGPFGDRVRAALSAVGTELLLPPADSGDTGVCVTMVEPDGERTFVTATGVEAQLSSSDLAALEIRPGDAIYVSGYDLAYESSGRALAEWIVRVGDMAQPVVDPGPLVADIQPDILHAVLSRTAVLTANRRETELLAGATEPTLAADALLPRLAPGALLVLRDGQNGCTIAGRGIPPTPVPAVAIEHVYDTTGAGDVHTGTLIARLMAGDAPVRAAARANEAAATLVSAPR